MCSCVTVTNMVQTYSKLLKWYRVTYFYWLNMISIHYSLSSLPLCLPCPLSLFTLPYGWYPLSYNPLRALYKQWKNTRNSVLGSVNGISHVSYCFISIFFMLIMSLNLNDDRFSSYCLYKLCILNSWVWS